MPTELPIAVGRTAEVFAWRPGTILKLYLPQYPAAAAEHEFRQAAAAHATGARVPAALELVAVDGRSGLIYERVDGPTLGTTMTAAPEQMDAAAALMAELHVALHRLSAPDAPPQHARLAHQIQSAPELSHAVRAQVLAELAQLPAGAQLCHGDFHPENIVMAADGPVIIDWVDLTAGNPCADVARTALLLRNAALPDGLTPEHRRLIHAMRNHFCDVYVARYAELQGIALDAIQAWERVVAAARLSEGLADAAERRALAALAAAA